MKLLLAVITAQGRAYQERHQAQLETWIPTAISAGLDVQAFDGDRLGVGDDYYSGVEKTKGMCQYAESEGYDFAMKLDDDTYIDVPRFIPPIQFDYTGLRQKANDYGTSFPSPGVRDFPPGTYPHDYASGGAYWMSRKSFTIIASAEVDVTWPEDRWVGHKLAEKGIEFKEHSDFTIGLDSRCVVCTQLGARGVRALGDLHAS